MTGLRAPKPAIFGCGRSARSAMRSIRPIGKLRNKSAASRGSILVQRGHPDARQTAAGGGNGALGDQELKQRHLRTGKNLISIPRVCPVMKDMRVNYPWSGIPLFP